MSFDAHANLANSLVATAPSPATSGTSLSVTAGQGALFPAAPFNCIVCPANTLPTQSNAEIIRVTAVVGDGFTIVRAQEGTSAKSIDAGFYIANAVTVKTLTDVESAASAPPLSSISAATGANTIASGNNTGQVWNWANTANSTVAMTIGETTAATNGTSTSGIPNQILFKLATLATSTQAPLAVYSRGSFVFAVSPTTAQVFAAAGTTPVYSFAGMSDVGLAGDTNRMLYFGDQHLLVDRIGTQIISASTSVVNIASAASQIGLLGQLSLPVRAKDYTVGALPSAATYVYGITAVSDATNAAGTGLGTAPTGGGSVKRIVYSDGANWLLM